MIEVLNDKKDNGDNEDNDRNRKIVVNYEEFNIYFGMLTKNEDVNVSGDHCVWASNKKHDLVAHTKSLHRDSYYEIDNIMDSKAFEDDIEQTCPSRSRVDHVLTSNSEISAIFSAFFSVTVQSVSYTHLTLPTKA